MKLLDALDKTTSELSHDPRIQEVSCPGLFHPDLHMRNIFVSSSDPTKITGVIDWQSTSVDPILLHAHITPDLCSRPRFLEDLLEGEESDEAGEEGQQGSSDEHQQLSPAERQKIDADRCRKAWEMSLRVYARKLHDARVLDEALLRPFRQCFSSWQYGATANRGVLRELCSRWHELSLPGNPPYQPSDEDNARDAKLSEGLEAVLTLEKWHQHALNVVSDGWVAADRWEDVLELHEEFYNNWMEAAAAPGDDDMTEDKARKMWPFDPPSVLSSLSTSSTGPYSGPSI